LTCGPLAPKPMLGYGLFVNQTSPAACLGERAHAASWQVPAGASAAAAPNHVNESGKGIVPGLRPTSFCLQHEPANHEPSLRNSRRRWRGNGVSFGRKVEPLIEGCDAGLLLPLTRTWSSIVSTGCVKDEAADLLVLLLVSSVWPFKKRKQCQYVRKNSRVLSWAPPLRKRVQ